MTQLEKRRQEKLKQGIRERMRTKDAHYRRREGKTRAYANHKIPNAFHSNAWKKEPELMQKLKDEVKAENRLKANRKHKKTLAKPNLAKAKLELEAVAAEQDELDENTARRELAQRALARKHLIASVLRFNPEYLAGWVHRDICERLEKFMAAVEAKENPRLMLQMPPRHGKSTLASIEFPSFVLGHHPNWELIVCSYAESLALDFSRAVRERMRDKEFKVLFPHTVLDKDNQNAQGWKLTKKGGFLPAGVEGPITGKGAHILIIDDPIKNAAEAESELKRTNIMRWYETTAYTRLAPGGGVLVIQTRWHLDDLSGRLEANMLANEGDTFEIVRYPAIATEDEKHRKKGEPLHAARYNKAQLKMIRKVSERAWTALYQQNPVPDEGAAFQQSMIQYYRPEQLPESLTKVAAWDLAIGQKEVNNKTVGLTWGKDIIGQFWFVDCRHGHFDAFEIVDEICDAFEKHEPYVVGIEKDKVAMAVGPLLDTVIQDRELYKLYVEELKPAREGNKLERCRTLQGLMRQGKVFLPHPDDQDWVTEFVTELLQFPYGRLDDHVDAAAWLGLLAADTPSPGLNYSRMPKRESWRDKLRTMGRRDRTMMSS